MRSLGMLVLACPVKERGMYGKELLYVTAVLAWPVQIRVPMHTNIDEFQTTTRRIKTPGCQERQHHASQLKVLKKCASIRLGAGLL
jgi:hypothetical protein